MSQLKNCERCGKSDTPPEPPAKYGELLPFIIKVEGVQDEICYWLCQSCYVWASLELKKRGSVTIVGGGVPAGPAKNNEVTSTEIRSKPENDSEIDEDAKALIIIFVKTGNDKRIVKATKKYNTIRDPEVISAISNRLSLYAWFSSFVNNLEKQDDLMKEMEAELMRDAFLAVVQKNR